MKNITEVLDNLVAEHGSCRDALNVTVTQLEAAKKEIKYLREELAKGDVTVSYEIFVNDSLWGDQSWEDPEQIERFWEKHKHTCGCNINLPAEIRRVTETVVTELVKELPV